MKNKTIAILFVFFAITSIGHAQNLKLGEGESFINVNGVDHWVKVKGVSNNTIPLIIIHGGPGGHNYSFERTIGPLLEKHVTIIYYEQRGCGRSKASKDTTAYTLSILIDDLEELRKALKIEKMNLLGFSFGAELAARYTAVYPNHVEKLILSCPAEISTSVILVQIQGLYQLADSNLRLKIDNILKENIPILDKWLKIWVHTSTAFFDEFSFYNPEAAKLNRSLWMKSNLPHEGSHHLQRVIFENAKGDLLETIEGLNTETLIISGIHDKNGGLQYGLYINKILPRSELKIYMKSAHFPDIDETERYAKDVITFITKN
nr:alpha/beta fold hydrolase [uncultured Draconibacterium sp.]